MKKCVAYSVYPINAGNIKHTIMNHSYKLEERFFKYTVRLKEFRISKLNLFHSLIVYKEKEVAKYSDLQKTCLILLLFRVR